MSPEFWWEPSIVALPEEWLAKPLVSRFYATKPRITLSCVLPPVKVQLGREAIVALWRLLAMLPEGEAAFQFPTEVSQGIIWELHICTEVVLVSLGMDAVALSESGVYDKKPLDSFVEERSLHPPVNEPLSHSPANEPLSHSPANEPLSHPPINEPLSHPPINEQSSHSPANEQHSHMHTSLSQDDFCLLSLSPLHFTLTVGMGLVDALASFSSASLESRFIGLAAPLLQESLSGYDETVETDSWTAALRRYYSLPSRGTRLLSIEGPTAVHIACHPHVLPTGTLPWGKPSPCRSLTLGSFIGVDVTTETLGIDLDDVAIADLCDALLVLGDLFPRESSTVEWDECEVQSSVLVQLSVERAFLDLSFQQQEFQSLVLPNVSFECGFPRHFHADTLLPGSFECGLTTAGIYWIDQTTEYSTNLVLPLPLPDA